METALAPRAETRQNGGAALAHAVELALIEGDLSALSTEQRIEYYNRVCVSLGLNPLTKPFEYLKLNGKLILYARKECTEQLRKLHGVSVRIASRERIEDVWVVTAQATDRSGRVEESIGAVAIGAQKGEPLANSLMKGETKAKRRVTLAICGLGMLDETELETIPTAARVVNTNTGEVIGLPQRVAQATETAPSYAAATTTKGAASAGDLKLRFAGLYEAVTQRKPGGSPEDKAAFKLYVERSLGREVALKSLTDDDLRTLIGDIQRVEGLRKRGFALAKQAGIDPAEGEGEIMRINMMRVLDRPVTTRTDITAREWRAWNDALEAQMKGAPIEADPFEANE